MQIPNGFELTSTNLKEEDKGIYRCEIKASNGNVYHYSYKLHVYSKLTIIFLIYKSSSVIFITVLYKHMFFWIYNLFLESKNDMPIIVEGPTNTTVLNGGTAVFTCYVSNLSQSSITWLHHSNEHPSSINISDFPKKYVLKVSISGALGELALLQIYVIAERCILIAIFSGFSKIRKPIRRNWS